MLAVFQHFMLSGDYKGSRAGGLEGSGEIQIAGPSALV